MYTAGRCEVLKSKVVRYILFWPRAELGLSAVYYSRSFGLFSNRRLSVPPPGPEPRIIGATLPNDEEILKVKRLILLSSKDPSIFVRFNSGVADGPDSTLRHRDVTTS